MSAAKIPHQPSASIPNPGMTECRAGITPPSRPRCSPPRWVGVQIAKERSHDRGIENPPTIHLLI